MSPERGGGRRLAAGLTHDELSKDLAHLQTKLATKRAAIRRLEEKVKLVELERDYLRRGLGQIVTGSYPASAIDAETWAQEVLDRPEAVEWETEGQPI